MTISEVVDKLRQEREFGSRFPARIIFTEDLVSYSNLVGQLKSACDITINVADFGKGDIIPQFDKLQHTIVSNKDKHILLLSVGEYLRMCVKRELNKERSQFPAFWESMQQESSKTRVVIPVFCCRDYFDRIIGKVDERQEGYVWTLNSSKTEIHNYSISVYSPEFSSAINVDAINFEEWLRNWDMILSHNTASTIITKQYKNIETSFGAINIKAIDSPFAYLKEFLVDGDRLEQSWESDNIWAGLIPYAHKGEQFSSIVLNILNITSFDFISVLARWKMLSNQQHELIWMWYRVYPSDQYYSFVCKKAKKADEIPFRIRDEILLAPTRSQTWIKERMMAMQALSFDSFEESYFRLLDKLPLEEQKLKLLTYKTHEEKAYAIRIVSRLLRAGADPNGIADMIKDLYPTLAVYLSGKSGVDKEVDEYMSWYRTNKLINRFSGNYPRRILYDRFNARLKQLNILHGKDVFTFWIDGFGVEWLPVFLKELEKQAIKPESIAIATAKLPTETEFNHQWDANDPLSEKWNRLDSYSHKGMPDDRSYFSCIAYQLSVFADAAQRVDELLNEHEYVIITGDHGSSRLAALAFHETSIVPVIAPPSAKVRSFGRFCELLDDGSNFIELDFMKKVMLDGKAYVVMNDYNKFSVSGNAAGGNNDEQDIVGEIHGGNTPEERLVPVVIIKRSRPLPPLTCKQKNKVVLRRNGHIETNLEFNRDVFSLEAFTESGCAICSKNSDGSWEVKLDGVSGDELNLSIIANGSMLPDKITLKVKGQGIDKNSGMGGLP